MELVMKALTVAGLLGMAVLIVVEVRRQVANAAERVSEKAELARAKAELEILRQRGPVYFCADCGGVPMDSVFLAKLDDGIEEYETQCRECGATVCSCWGTLEQLGQRYGKVETVCRRP